jgi:hypothetical protein
MNKKQRDAIKQYALNQPKHLVSESIGYHMLLAHRLASRLPSGSKKSALMSRLEIIPMLLRK